MNTPVSYTHLDVYKRQILFSPILVLTVIAIQLDSRGPIFADVPDRVGKNRKPFHLYKFRSMIPNAHQLLRTDAKFKQLYEEYKKGSYKLVDDPRVTFVGKYTVSYTHLDVYKRQP